MFRASAAAGDVSYDELSPSQVHERFPGFRVPDGYIGLFEAHAGVIHAARALAAFQSQATSRGAELRFSEPVVGWASSGVGIEVRTAKGRYEADRLILAAGPWTSRLVPELALPLEVLRVVNVTFDPLEPALYGADRCPSFIGIDGKQGFYGCPAVGGEGVKAGGGASITDPDHVRREVEAADIEPIRSFVSRFMPGAAGSVARTLTCLYTETPDGQFVIDHHPEHHNVVVASPCSGHGFKHASVIGPILADLALDGETAHDIGFMGIERFTHPNDEPPPAHAVWRRRADDADNPDDRDDPDDPDE
jgi:sarcosine oxidase